MAKIRDGAGAQEGQVLSDLARGDRLESDIAGAAAADMQSLWMSRSGAPVPTDGPQPYRTAESLIEVAEMLRH